MELEVIKNIKFDSIINELKIVLKIIINTVKYSFGLIKHTGK